MAWCTFCRREYPIDPGQFCPSCGNRTTPSTESTIHASALAQLTDEAPDVQVVEVIRQQPAVVYYQPVMPPASRRSRGRVQVVEMTSKFWKGQMALASMLIMAGVVMLIAGQDDGRHEATSVAWYGGAASVIGLVWLFFAKAGAWWNHG